MRNVITEWKNWRDIVATEQVVDLFAKPRYQSHAIHTWNRQSYGKRDTPRPMELSSFATAAWRQARIDSYANRLSPASLAGMLVDLEDAGGHCPEFEYDEEWPAAVAHLRVS